MSAEPQSAKGPAVEMTTAAEDATSAAPASSLLATSSGRDASAGVSRASSSRSSCIFAWDRAASAHFSVGGAARAKYFAVHRPVKPTP